MKNHFSIELPDWVHRFLGQRRGRLRSDDDAMAVAIGLAAENVRRRSGGPFAALVVDQAEGDLIGVGVNLVVSAGLSCAHAEMVALSLSQRQLGVWDLGSRGSLTLVTTCAPCAMCYGAVPWSGVRALVCGARSEDAKNAGFDEGDKSDDWPDSLRRRGIEVRHDVLRAQAIDLFRLYEEAGGVVYNPDGDGN